MVEKKKYKKKRKEKEKGRGYRKTKHPKRDSKKRPNKRPMVAL
jgi:hypothetical protein